MQVFLSLREWIFYLINRISFNTCSVPGKEWLVRTPLYDLNPIWISSTARLARASFIQNTFSCVVCSWSPLSCWLSSPHFQTFPLLYLHFETMLVHGIHSVRSPAKLKKLWVLFALLRQDQLWPVLDQWNEIATVFPELWQKSINSKATLFFHSTENDIVESGWWDERMESDRL